MPISPEIQIQRQNKLLAKTRQMIREVGVNNLSVRKLASYCGVSVPTLYNRFSNKENLIAAAADEIFRWHFEKMSPPHPTDGFENILYISDSTSDVITRNQELARLIVRKIPSDNDSMALARNLYKKCLVQIKESGDLVAWMSIDFISQLLYSRIRSASIEWSRGQISDAHLKGVRRIEISLMLSALTTGETHTRLQDILRREIGAIQADAK